MFFSSTYILGQALHVIEIKNIFFSFANEKHVVGSALSWRGYSEKEEPKRKQQACICASSERRRLKGREVTAVRPERIRSNPEQGEA